LLDPRLVRGGEAALFDGEAALFGGKAALFGGEAALVRDIADVGVVCINYERAAQSLGGTVWWDWCSSVLKVFQIGSSLRFASQKKWVNSAFSGG
jgi:hypothetical protein